MHLFLVSYKWWVRSRYTIYKINSRRIAWHGPAHIFMCSFILRRRSRGRERERERDGETGIFQFRSILISDVWPINGNGWPKPRSSSMAPEGEFDQYIYASLIKTQNYEYRWSAANYWHFSLNMMEVVLTSLNLSIWLSPPEIVLHGWLAGLLLNINQVRSQVFACLMSKWSGVFLQRGLAFFLLSRINTGQYCVFKLISLDFQ